MEFINATSMTAGYTMSTDKAGREALVVVVKGTYGIPEHDTTPPQLLKDQAPLVMADVFHGEPGRSPVRYDNDFAPTKPRCDVLLNGSCHAPNGLPATQATVALKLGTLTKAFRVVGQRRYRDGVLSLSTETPEPFTALPIHYGHAYGGADETDPDPARHQWFSSNHVGRGFHADTGGRSLDGKPLSLTEELDQPAIDPRGNYQPMAFGPIGRGWQQRIRWAGTYDQGWLDQQFPFLPLDFDPRYFQSAPEDQQIDYPQGGERVALLNLTPRGQTLFRLPASLHMPMLFEHRAGDLTEIAAVVDTVLIEPDENRFALVWRASMPLQRNIREMARVMVGRSKAQVLAQRAHQDRLRGKRRFKSLADAVRWAATNRRPAAARSSPSSPTSP